VARALVVYLQRAGGQSWFSAPPARSNALAPAFRGVVDLVIAE
jgi:hypothetical protein